MSNVAIIAHRGGRRYKPENSLEAFRLCAEEKIKWIELDVRCTKDHKAVVFHDKRLIRLAGNFARINNLTLSQIKRVKLFSRQNIPTLEEALECVSSKIKFDIELKDAASAPKVATAINRRVADGQSYDDFIVSSFDTEALRSIKTIDPNIKIVLIHHIWPLKFKKTTDLPLFGVAFNKFVAPKFAIRSAKKQGLWVAIYTVNSSWLARNFAKMKVDAIISDAPKKLL